MTKLDRDQQIPSKEEREIILNRLQRFSDVMEGQWTIPFTRIPFGLDFLIGLVPVVGDVFTGLLSLWLVMQARKFKLSTWVYFRMAANILLDVILGSIPLLGDLFDLAFRANKRNLKLILFELERLETS